jgi:hypothetical protein
MSMDENRIGGNKTGNHGDDYILGGVKKSHVRDQHGHKTSVEAGRSKQTDMEIAQEASRTAEKAMQTAAKAKEIAQSAAEEVEKYEKS